MGLHNPFDFSGRTVLLTGAAGGLGRPIAYAFAQAGAQLALCDIDERGLTAMVNDLASTGTSLVFSRVNLCSREEVRSFVESAYARIKRIDVLGNLAGGIIRKPSTDYTIEEWQHVLDINLKACWLCCLEVGKIMLRQRQGRIINFSSNAAFHGVPGYPAYSPAKAGVLALTRVLAVEWGPFGICSNAVCPGFTKTPFNEELLAEPVRVGHILARMPFGELLPDDALVGPTLFLASDAARWINGHTLHVDSGYHIT